MEPQELTSIDVALNEASWLTFEYDLGARRVTLGFDVLTLPNGPGGEGHTLVNITLSSVGRTVASLRLGRWNDDQAEIVPLELRDLPETVEWFGTSPLYGWDFFDVPESSWERWNRRLSLDERWPGGSELHAVNLFQERRRDGKDRHLDVRIWFGELVVADQAGNAIPLADFAAGGRRWWDALNARNDERVRGFGIVPGALPDSPDDGVQ